MDIPNTIVAMVHDRVGEALASFLSGGDNPFFIRLSPADTLLAQLEDTSVTLPRVSAGFIGDIALSSVSGVVNKLRSLSQDSQASGGAGLPKLPNPADLVAQVRSALGRRLPFPPQQQDTNPEGVIESLVGILDREGQEIGQATKDFQERFNTILGGLVRPGRAADDTASVGRLKQILGRDTGTIIPIAAIANAVRGVKNVADVPHSIEQGLLAYFFSSDGFKTIDGESVVAPVHLSDLKGIAESAISVGPKLDVKVNPASVKQVKGLFTTATAEQYLRDTIRVIVESAYDALRGLQSSDGKTGLFGTVTTRLRTRKQATADQEAVVTKFVTWFRGFSSMAESGAMRAVEVGTQGVSEFQTNPLIAAAAGAFAGTVARKLAQSAFLDLLTTELNKAG